MQPQKNYDFHSYKQRLESLTRRIQKDNQILPANKTKLFEYITYLEEENNIVPLVCRKTDQAFKLMQWLNKDFKELTKEDIDFLLKTINQQKQLADNTKSLYKLSLKLYVKWLAGLNKEDEYPELVKKIKCNKDKKTKVLPEELLNENEVLQIINNANNSRNKAMLSLMWETGCRIGELANAKIKHLTFNANEAQIVLNGKTGMRKNLLISCVPYLKAWINNEHPNKNNKDSPLFCLVGNRLGNGLTYASVRKAIFDAMEKASVNKPTNPHLWRHSRATYLASRLTEAQLCAFMGWVQGSREVAVYIASSGVQVNESLRKMYGLSTAQEQEEISKLKPVNCSICGEINPPQPEENAICQKCNNPLTVQAMLKKQQNSEENLNERIEKIAFEMFKDIILKNITPTTAKEIMEKAVCKVK